MNRFGVYTVINGENKYVRGDRLLGMYADRYATHGEAERVAIALEKANPELDFYTIEFPVISTINEDGVIKINLPATE